MSEGRTAGLMISKWFNVVRPRLINYNCLIIIWIIEKLLPGYGSIHGCCNYFKNFVETMMTEKGILRYQCIICFEETADKGAGLINFKFKFWLNLKTFWLYLKRWVWTRELTSSWSQSVNFPDFIAEKFQNWLIL